MFNVVFASSNEYSPFLLITLTSLLENNKDDFDCINIFILDNGINDNNKNKILSLTNKYPCKITFIALEVFDSLDFNLPTINLKNTISLASYARLFISSVLPNDIKKVLYLDSDGLVVGSFKELWEMDIDEYYCAGVLDPLSLEPIRSLFWYYDVDSYINSGFLLINLEKWRENNIEEEFIKFLYDNRKKFFWGDQGVINLVLENKIKIIEPRYNLLFYFQYQNYDMAKKLCGISSEYYNKEIVDYSRENPIFVHFAGSGHDSPWHNKNHKYNPLYEKYAKMAGCEEVIEYMDVPLLKTIVFYKYDNIFFTFLQKLIPKKMIIDYMNNKFIRHNKDQQSWTESNLKNEM